MKNLILWFLRIWRTNFGSITLKNDFIQFIIKLDSEQYYSGVLFPIYKKSLADNFIKDNGFRPPTETQSKNILNYCWCVLEQNKGQIFLPKKGFPKNDDSEAFFLITKDEIIDSEKISNEEFISLRDFIYIKKNTLKDSLNPETYYILIEPL